MFKKVLFVSLVVALLLPLGAVNVLAGGEDNPPRQACPPVYIKDSKTWTSAYYCDGRLNAFDLLQTVAVYQQKTTEPVWRQVVNKEGKKVWEQVPCEVVCGLSFWVIDNLGIGQEAMIVPKAQITAAVNAGTDTVIAEGKGVTMGYNHLGYLWVTGPGGYTFTWKP